MKISRLFHWLYAILMLLPFAFFVPSVLYYAFNDNSTMQTVEVPKTETIAVDFNQLLQYGDFENNPDGYWRVTQGTLSLNDNRGILSNFEEDTQRVEIYTNGIKTFANHSYYLTASFSSNGYLNAYISGIGNSYQTQLTNVSEGKLEVISLQTVDNDNTFFDFYMFFITNSEDYVITNFNFMLIDLTQMFGYGNEPTISEFSSMFPNSYYDYNLSQPMQVIFNTGETEEIISNTDIINYAWESIWDLPLFSWTKITFVSVPFSYLTGIFGIGASNSLNYVFGYFVTISIVWLVFDLLLYVPMLAHNWIDKARIE